jgi:hypothetical protein
MKALKIFLFVLLTVPGFAQQQPETPAEPIEVDPRAQEKIKAAHAAYITERLGLSSGEAEKFWPVYREYAQKRQEIRQQFRDARRSGKDEKELLDLDFKVKQQELDLEKDYSGKFQQVISPQKVMHLRQAEGDFRKLLLRQIQQRQMQRERQQEMRDRSQQRLQHRNN